MLKLGYKASAEQFAPAKLLDFAVLAEKTGFDSAFVSDHFQPWKHVDGHAPSSLVWLGALGARTSKLVMGTSVLTPTFRYHPSIVAQTFGTLGSMFPGRVILGIGTGESLNEVPSTGAPWPEFKERFARMREAVTLIRTLWRGERISFEGEYYKTEKATIYDRPADEIPIYVAAARAIELGAEVQNDPRLVELILSESVRVVRNRPNVLIVEHRRQPRRADRYARGAASPRPAEAVDDHHRRRPEL